MLWNKNKKLVIQCPVCEWDPIGEELWRCSCGHRWNTFETKGKCPSCGIKWKDTSCPSCKTSSPHKTWYKTPKQLKEIEEKGNKVLRARKKSIESSLIQYGIRNYRISYMPYLDYSNEVFQSEYDAACRMVILYAIAYASFNLEERDFIINWLQEQLIWSKVSPKEQAFLRDPEPEENALMNFSWRMESAITLGWCLNIVKNLPRLDDDETEDAIEEFMENVPEIGDSLLLFLSKLEYRDFGEIYEENLLNELVTTYLRDIMINGEEDKTDINTYTSFERHYVLNWLRTTYVGETETTGELWDEVETST